MEQLAQVEGSLTPPQKLPQEPKGLAYSAASLLQIPTAEKQALLEAPDTMAILEDARTLYRREVAFMRSMLERQSLLEQNPVQQGPFSLN